MTHGSISSELLKFAIPMAIGLLFQQLYNTVDAMVVGQYVGKAALAAVGSTASIVNMLIGLFAGLSTGAGVVISQAYGAKAEKRLSEAVQTTITLTFILSAVATIIGILIVDPMLRLMDTPEDVLPEAKAYLTIYFAGSTGLLFYNMARAYCAPSAIHAARCISSALPQLSMSFSTSFLSLAYAWESRERHMRQ